jgi:transposase
VSRPSPFTVTLTATDRRVLQGRLRRPTAQQRNVLRAKIVLAAAEGEQHIQIAGRLGVAVNTVSEWRKRFSQEGRSGLRDRKRPGRPRHFPSAVVIEVKAVACELPATRGVPLGRWSLAELRRGRHHRPNRQVSVSTLWRWLEEDALKPWRHRSWIFRRDLWVPAIRSKSCDLRVLME